MTDLLSTIENIKGSIAYKYQLRDNVGNSADCIKIIDHPTSNSYIGIYHTLNGSTFNSKIGISTDLINWTYKFDIEPGSSQPYIYQLSDGSYFVAVETDGGNHLRFKHYTNISTLMNNTVNKSTNIPRTLGNYPHGTPNVYSATLNSTNPNTASTNINNSVIEIGFHYNMNGNVDRQARGTFTNFSTWSASADNDINNAIINLSHPGGNIGDRDSIAYNSVRNVIVEGQQTKGDFRTWKLYLYRWNDKSVVQLIMAIHETGLGIGNAHYSKVKHPLFNNTHVLVVSGVTFRNKDGHAGESFIYYNPFPESGTCPILTCKLNI